MTDLRPLRPGPTTMNKRTSGEPSFDHGRRRKSVQEYQRQQEGVEYQAGYDRLRAVFFAVDNGFHIKTVYDWG